MKEDPDLVALARLVERRLGGKMLLGGGPLYRPLGFVKNPPDLDGPRRQFFHFTSLERLPLILEHGIAKGDVAITHTGGYNAPWLTVNPSFEAQTWTSGASEDKRAVRLTIEMAEKDPLLRHWPKLAKSEKMDEDWYAILSSPDGVLAGPDDWYVYFGIIPSRWVCSIESAKPIKVPDIEEGTFALAGPSTRGFTKIRN